MPNDATVTIEKLVYGGEGLARLEGHVALVPYVLPGETVRGELAPVKKDLLRGRLVEVLSPSAARVAPTCPYFQHCGGCQYQHAGYAAQVENKIAILREVLRRVGKIEFDGEVAAVTGEPWGYRNRVQLHFDSGVLGYFEYGSRRLCAIDQCPIASPALNQAITKLAETKVRFSGAVELFTNETDLQINVLDRAPREVFSALSSIGTTVPIVYAGFQVSRNSFFQVNRFLIDSLVGAAIGDREGSTAVDLYAGVGLFSRSLAERFRRVVAVEAAGSAVRDLQHNLGERAEVENMSVEEFLPDYGERPDFILADPPRAGLGTSIVRELGRIQATSVAIVSCDPATLARDLKELLAAGYRLDKVTLVDLFPQTYHIETVAQLERA